MNNNETNYITHLICLLVENDGQRENGAPFFQSSGKSLPVAVEFARLQTNGWCCVVAGVTQSLSYGCYVTNVGTDILHRTSQANKSITDMQFTERNENKP